MENKREETKNRRKARTTKGLDHNLREGFITENPENGEIQPVVENPKPRNRERK